ncbi:MAG: glycosyltransferase family 4 protein [Candidatus Omnitrophota bacterium]
MDIAIISPLDYTGISYYTHSLCQSLSEAGVNVTLFTVDKRIISPEKVLYVSFSTFKNTYGNIQQFKKGIFYLAAIVKTYFLLLKNNIRIVHCQILDFPEVDVVFFLILRLSRISVIFTPHDIYSLKNKKNNLYLYILYRFSNCIIVHNKSNKDILTKSLGIVETKIRIIAHGNYNYFLKNINKLEARAKVGLSLNKKILLLIGNIRKGKGVETSVSSLKFLRPNDNVILLIAGKLSKGFDINKLNEVILKNNLQKSVLLKTGFIEDSMLEYFYRCADIVLVPYEEAYESGVLKYAFSCELPVIVSNLKEFSDFAKDGDNCLIFDSGNAEDLSSKIEILLKDGNFAKSLASNAKQYSDKEWGWNDVAKKTVKIYKSFAR